MTDIIPTPGDSLGAIAQSMFDMAQTGHVEVRCRFNGVDLRADKSTKLSDIIRQWDTPGHNDPWRTLALDLLHYIEHGTAAYHGDTPKLQSFKQRMAELEQ